MAAPSSVIAPETSLRNRSCEYCSDFVLNHQNDCKIPLQTIILMV